MYQKNADQREMDLSVLGWWREASAILLFIVAPVVQIASSRWLPLAILLAFLCIQIGHALTRWRQVPSSDLGKYWRPSSWSADTRFMALAYAGFWLYAFVSLSWSPLPMLGMRDLGVLLVAPLITFILATEQWRTKVLSFPTILIIGILVTLGLQFLELSGYTQFHALIEDRAGLHDLNRSAVLLAILCPALFLMAGQTCGRSMLLVIVAIGYVLMLKDTHSLASQLMVPTAVATAIVIHFFPKLYVLVFPVIAACILVTPLLLEPLYKAVSKESGEMVLPPTAQYRVELWRGYSDHIGENWVWGHGIRANRAYGTNWNSIRYVKQSEDYPNDKVRAGYPKQLYTHAHNAAIEYWTDYGLVGILFLGTFLITVGRRTTALPNKVKSAIAATAVAGFCYSMAAVTIAQSWWLVSVAMACIALFAVAQSRAESS